MNDVRKTIYGTILGFFMVLGLWFSIIYLSSCGFTLTCRQASPKVYRTPIPTLAPVSHSEASMEISVDEFDRCEVHALDLVGAWVSAGAPETDAFPFTDINDTSCSGTYADIQPLFVENSFWQTGSLGCVSCHNSDLTDRSAGIDLSSYGAISGSNILGGSWDDSRLHQALILGLSPDGHSADVPAGNPFIFAGTQVAAEGEATPSPSP